jgi:hypothetical protein
LRKIIAACLAGEFPRGIAPVGGRRLGQERCFGKAYAALPPDARAAARKTNRLWKKSTARLGAISEMRFWWRGRIESFN